MDIKAKTNILGDEISVYSPQATKLMKITAEVKKTAKKSSAGKSKSKAPTVKTSKKAVKKGKRK